MTFSKDVKGSGMPWEEQYEYATAVKVDEHDLRVPPAEPL
jgi:hypothetical protein